MAAAGETGRRQRDSVQGPQGAQTQYPCLDERRQRRSGKQSRFLADAEHSDGQLSEVPRLRFSFSIWDSGPRRLTERARSSRIARLAVARLRSETEFSGSQDRSRREREAVLPGDDFQSGRVVGLRASRFLERILPSQSWKSREVRVGGGKTPAVLDRECRQLRVCNQRAMCLASRDHLAQQGPMMLARGQHPNVGLRDPLIEQRRGVFGGHAFADDLWIGDQTQESPCSLPGQTYRLSAG